MRRLIILTLVLGLGCTPIVKESVTQSRAAIKDLKGGVKEPTYPPYCWVSPPGSDLWYPCGQTSEEDLGKHGH